MTTMNAELNLELPLDQRVAALRERVANRERILRENTASRWYDQSRRDLAVLKDELADLERQAAAP